MRLERGRGGADGGTVPPGPSIASISSSPPLRLPCRAEPCCNGSAGRNEAAALRCALPSAPVPARLRGGAAERTGGDGEAGGGGDATGRCKGSCSGRGKGFRWAGNGVKWGARRGCIRGARGAAVALQLSCLEGVRLGCRGVSGGYNGVKGEDIAELQWDCKRGARGHAIGMQ